MKSNSKLLWQVNGVVRVVFWFGLAIMLYIVYGDATTQKENTDSNTREIKASITLRNTDDGRVTRSLTPADTLSYSALKPINLYVSGTNTSITVHPQTTFATLLVILQNYNVFITGLIILRLLNLLLACLETDFSFSEALPRYIRYIANTLIISQLIAYITDKLISANFAQTLFTDKIKNGTTQTIIEVTAGSSTSFIAFFTGLLLLIIARLMKLGYQLQQENELTI